MPCSSNGADTRSLVEGVTCGGLPDANRPANSVCDSANPNRDIQVCSSLKLFKFSSTKNVRLRGLKVIVSLKLDNHTKV